jgi:hypothetical protein
MGSQLDPLLLSRVGSRERLSSPNFPQLHFGEPSSGFTPGLGSASAYLHVLDEKRSKLDPKVEKCIFIGYSLKQKGYRCFNPSTWKLQASRDVVFDEMVN